MAMIFGIVAFTWEESLGSVESTMKSNQRKWHFIPPPLNTAQLYHQCNETVNKIVGIGQCVFI